jgi:hypothetical protein
MFAALSENPKFYRSKMKCFIAVVRLTNLTSPRINLMKEDPKVKKAL